jgi:hypothetical protein
VGHESNDWCICKNIIERQKEIWDLYSFKERSPKDFKEPSDVGKRQRKDISHSL